MRPSPRLLKFLRRSLLALAIAATLFVAFVVVENWRGDRAWAAEERALRARGEPLDIAAFATPPIPDERNFFKAPGIADLLFAKFGFQKNNNPWVTAILPALRVAMMGTNANNYDADGRLRAGIKPEVGSITPNDPRGDLHLARKNLLRAKLITGPLSDEPAQDILAAIQPVQTLLDAVGQAARERPDAWLPARLPTEQPSIDPSLLLNLAGVLAGRAKAELALGRTDDAFTDAAAILALANATRAGTPSLLIVLVGEAVRGAAADVLKEGCRRRLWTDSQLAMIENSLADLQSFIQLRKSFLFGRVWMTGLLDSAPREPMHGDTNDTLPHWLFHGWRQQNKVSGSHALEDELASFDATTGRMFSDRLQNLKQAANAIEKARSPYVWVTAKMVINISSSLYSFGQTENGLREAIAACALERHRLARGSYPVTLAELAPAFITAVPADVFTGQTLGYARTPDGGFKLTALAADGNSEGRTWVQPDSP